MPMHPDGVMILDTGYRVAYWSRGAQALYGWSAAEAAGKDVRRLLKTRSSVPPGEVRRILSARGLWEGELENTRQDGTVVRVACRLALERKVRGQPATLLAVHTGTGSSPGAGRPARGPVRAEGCRRRMSADLEEAEENLRRANERLELAHQAAGAGAWDWDVRSGQLTWCNHLFRLFGLDPRTATPSFETWLAILHPEDREAASSRIQSALKKHADLASEYRIVRPDGEIRWIDARGRGEYDRRGRPVRMIGICIDVTEKHRSQKALEDSERLYRAIGESIDYGVWVCAPDGRNTYASESFLKLVGLTQAQCSDFGWGDVLHPDDAERTIDAWKECVRTGGQWDIEHRFRGVDGRWHPILARGVPVRGEHGAITCWAGINLDISSLKQAQEALESARREAVNEKNRLEAVMEALPVGVAITDSRGGRLQFNRMYESIWGGPPPAVENVSDYAAYKAWWADTGRPIRPEEWASAQAVRHGRTVIGQLLEIERFDGGRRFILNSAAPILDVNGRVIGSAVAVQDVTASKQSEERIAQLNRELRRKVQELETVFETVPIGIAIAEDPEGLHIWGNPANERMVGVPKGGELSKRPHGQRAVAKFTPLQDKRELAWENLPMQRAVRGEKVTGQVMDLVREDGSRITLLSHAAPLFDESGCPRGAVGAFLDITHLKQAEEALRASEARYRSLAELSPDAIIVHQDGRFVYANPSALRLYGAGSPDQIIGRAVLDLIHPDDRELVARRMHAAYHRGIAPKQELRMLRLDGQSVPVESTAFPMTLQDLPAVTVLIRDITERKRLEAERLELERLKVLSDSRKLWQDTFDAITDLISIHDRDGSLRRANRAFLEYFELPGDNAAGKKYHELFPEEGYPAGGNPLEQCLAAATPASGEFNDTRRSRIFEIYTFPLGSDLEAVSGCIQVAKDITERRESELRLIVSERLAAVGQLAAGVAHEINNPLATISGCAEGLLSRIDQGYDPAGTREYLEIIREEVFRCKTITDGMLSFVRQSSYELRPVSVNDALDKDIEMMRLQGRLHNVQVQRQFAADLPPVRVREGELRQVFLALLANALDAMEDQGILTLRTGLEGEHVFAVIEDTGPGIAPEQRDRIFDLFFTTKAQKGGTGIGLPVVRKLVRGMSGQVTLERGAGRGAAFRVSLPAG